MIDKSRPTRACELKLAIQLQAVQLAGHALHGRVS